LEQLNPTTIGDHLDDRDNNMKVDEMGGVRVRFAKNQYLEGRG
jgi:hypothetical protein